MGRKERYVAPNTTNIVMQDDQGTVDARAFGFGYVLNKTEEECKQIFNEERTRNARFREIWKEAEEKEGTEDVYAIVKRAYTMESDLYKTFNEQSRSLHSFFEWENFPLKGFWLLLHKDLIRQAEEDSSSKMVYRGVSIPMVTKVGKFVKFTQFTSTSVDRSVPMKFMSDPKRSTLFEIKMESGLPLTKFSDFPDEEEFLLRPNDSFRVDEFKKDQTTGLTIICLEQVGSALF